MHRISRRMVAVVVLIGAIAAGGAAFTASISLLAAAAWLFFAPTRIGGSTTYVVTSGVSMQPRFHTGDLALVRPADHYRVGMIVAYRGSLLKVVVLHRIVAIHDGHYT